MNSTLDQSQKHINSIKSIFGGVKNWWTAKPAPSINPAAIPSSAANPNLRDIIDKAPHQKPAAPTPFGQQDRSSGSFTGGGFPGSGSSNMSPNKSYDSVLNDNLDQMSLGMSRLKGLAEGLGGEIETQNKLLDAMTTKADIVDVKIGAQQKHLDHILGKKK